MSRGLSLVLERRLRTEASRRSRAQPGESQAEVRLTKAAKPPRTAGPPESAQHFLGLNDHELPTEQLAIGRQMSPITDAAALGLAADSLLVAE